MSTVALERSTFGALEFEGIKILEHGTLGERDFGSIRPRDIWNSGAKDFRSMGHWEHVCFG